MIIKSKSKQLDFNTLLWTVFAKQAETSIPWLSEVLVLFTVSLQFCQQLKDKVLVFTQYKDMQSTKIWRKKQKSLYMFSILIDLSKLSITEYDKLHRNKAKQKLHIPNVNLNFENNKLKWIASNQLTVSNYLADFVECTLRSVYRSPSNACMLLCRSQSTDRSAVVSVWPKTKWTSQVRPALERRLE